MPEVTISRAFRSSFPTDFEDTGFRTQAWFSGKAKAPDELEPFHSTVLHAFAAAARCEPEVGITVLAEKPRGEPQHLSYQALYYETRRVAAGLLAHGVSPGDRVLLVLPTSLEFLSTFFATQLIGAIPVPSYPPSGFRMESGLARLAHIANHSGAGLCVVWQAIRPFIGDLVLRAPALREIVCVEELCEASAASQKFSCNADDYAFIQYTSGSTGNPKGVALRHSNLVANCHAIGQAIEVTRIDKMCGWCPLYHDMGLIGQILFPIYWRLPVVLLTPTAFLVRPGRWLRAMQDYRATISTAPNFGYALAVKRVTPEQREGLDLSSWRQALNGAEPVNLTTLQAFQTTYEPYGFPKHAFLPVYGLAEVSLAAAFPEPGTAIRSDIVDREELANGRAVPAEGEHAVSLVSVGHAVPGHLIKVVDEKGHTLPEREVGHIVVSGPSLMSGYFQDKAATDAVLRNGWLWTGDLGYMAGGELYIAGRARDLIIMCGKNYYAEDVERSVETVAGVRTGGVVAFGVYDDKEATDLLVVVAETKEADERRRMKLVEQISDAVSDSCGLAPDEIVLAGPGTIPKTSSGKRQRSLCRDQYLKNQLHVGKTGKLYLGYVFLRSKAGFLLIQARQLLGHRRAPE